MADETKNLNNDIEAIENPENIVKDLLNTEKQIAEEALQMYRLRFEREKAKWEKLFCDKDYQIHGLKQKYEDSCEIIKKLQKDIQDEKEHQLNQLRLTAEGMKEKKKSETKKWEEISDQIKFFREASNAAQNNLLQEQDRIAKLKIQFSELEEGLRKEIYDKDDSLIKQKESFLKKESELLENYRKLEEETLALKEQLNNNERLREKEKAKFKLVVEEYEKNQNKMQKALQDTIISLNSEREKNNELNEQLEKLNKNTETKEDELINLKKQFEEEKVKMRDQVDKINSSFKKEKEELFKRENTIRKNADEEIHNLLKSLEILQKQLEKKKR